MADELILGCHIAGVFGVNRNEILQVDDIINVEKWITSIERQRVHAILFHNHFSGKTIKQFESAFIKFVAVEYNSLFNPNVFRYFVYQSFLQQHKNISSVFVTDVSDVELLQNPFVDSLFTNNKQQIFCGDEPTILNNEWMKAHGALLRSRIDDYANFEESNSYETLLNCGIIGGRINTMISFIDQLCDIHLTYNFDNDTAYTGDMGAFNYLARTQFANSIIHGSPVNTIFKQYQIERNDCWFRHK